LAFIKTFSALEQLKLLTAATTEKREVSGAHYVCFILKSSPKYFSSASELLSFSLFVARSQELKQFSADSLAKRFAALHSIKISAFENEMPGMEKYTMV